METASSHWLMARKRSLQIFAFVAPEAERMRDFYHAAERIHAIGELRFGAATAEAKR